MSGRENEAVREKAATRVSEFLPALFNRMRISIPEPFEKFVDRWQCAAVMQREAVTRMRSCSGGVKVVVA
jgi:hypothetical protein